jgi:uncharacterized protein YfiM (DUF2279 family)
MVLACVNPWPAATQEPPEAPPALIAASIAVPAAGDHRLAGWTVVAGSYAVMAGYSYYSWYQEDKQRDFYVSDDGWFGKNTYAGGADKLGHCFSSYVITRAGYDVLSWAGLPRNEALTASLALDALFFAAIEIKDGKTENLGFSWGDVAANLCGNLLAAAFVLHPPLDRSLDFRLEYYPSREYLDAVSRTGTIDAVEDYTGMTFGLWYHLSELPGLKERPALAWLRFVDVGLTYGARNYRPEPDGDRPPERELSAALTLNVAAIVRALAADRAPRVAGASDWVFEYFTIPKTTLEVR